MLKSKLEGEIAFWLAFLNLLILFLVATIGDLLILDWLIVSKNTHRFVIIPGTEAEDYKDFSHHYKDHVKATIAIIPILVVIAGVVYFI